MPNFDVSVARYTNDPVKQAYGCPNLTELPVNLVASSNYVRGQILGELIATPGTFGAWVAPLLAGVTTVAVTSNVATITTATTHGFSVGQYVTLAGLTNGVLNGTYLIASTPSGTTFTFAKTTGNIASGADVGTASATSGVGNARCVLPLPCSTDASGNITVGSNADPAGFTEISVPAIFDGFLNSVDIAGLTAVSAASLGKLIKGTLTAGVFRVGV